MRISASRPAGLALAGFVILFAGLAGPAHAAPPPAPSPAPPPPPPPPPPKVAPTLKLGIGSPLKARSRVVGVKGERVRINGVISPFAAGVRVVVTGRRRGNTVR